MRKRAGADPPSTTPPQTSLPIGAVAALVGVATSTLRYYERRGLVVADSRASGQRRYEPATVRRLVFVQMLQDAGLTLDEIQAISVPTTTRPGRRSPTSDSNDSTRRSPGCSTRAGCSTARCSVGSTIHWTSAGS